MKNCVLFWIFAFTFISCKKELLDPNLIISIDDEFKIDLWEDLHAGQGTFNFLIETIKQYNCIDNSIDYRVNSGAGNIVITLEKIDENADCDPGPSPATAKIPLADAKSGNFQISIKLKETIKNTGLLKVTPEKYEFSLEEKLGVALSREEIYRVPKGTIWGYVAFDSQDELEAVDNFLMDLENVSQVEKRNYQKGYYGHFSIEDNQTVQVNDPEEPANSKHFIYHFTGDIGTLKDRAEQFSAQQNGKAIVKLLYFL